MVCNKRFLLKYLLLLFLLFLLSTSLILRVSPQLSSITLNSVRGASGAHPGRVRAALSAQWESCAPDCCLRLVLLPATAEGSGAGCWGEQPSLSVWLLVLFVL